LFRLGTIIRALGLDAIFDLNLADFDAVSLGELSFLALEECFAGSDSTERTRLLAIKMNRPDRLRL